MEFPIPVHHAQLFLSKPPDVKGSMIRIQLLVARDERQMYFSQSFVPKSSEFRVQSSEFRVQSSEFRVQSSEFRVQSSVVSGQWLMYFF